MLVLDWIFNKSFIYHKDYCTHLIFSVSKQLKLRKISSRKKANQYKSFVLKVLNPEKIDLFGSRMMRLTLQVTHSFALICYS
jgi:hypothetical protein